MVAVDTLTPRVQQIAELLAKHAAQISNADAGRIAIDYSGQTVRFRLLPAERPIVNEQRSLLRRAV